jgi:hypothetical protein
MADPTMKPLGQQIAQFVAKIAPEIKMFSEMDRGRFLIPIDEKAHLSDAKPYLSDVLHCPWRSWRKSNLYDSEKNKIRQSLRPAIYIE